MCRFLLIMTGVYKITSPSSRIYVGQSINIEKRFNKYEKKQNVSEQKKLYNSFLKYGVENHKFEIIEECIIDLLNERERYWQDFYNVLKEGLNCRLTTTNDKSGFFSKETKLKMSNSAKNKKLSDSHRKNISIAVKKRTFMMSFKGMKHSDETKLFLSERQKGTLNHNFGKKHSEETKMKMSLSRKGENNPMYGKKQSIKTKVKIQKNRTKPKSKKGKIVLNIENGIFYQSAKEVSFLYNINYVSLCFKLSGRNKNNTNFIYC